MVSALIRRFFAVVIALNLIGGAAIQFATPARALISPAATAASDPCAQMNMDMRGNHDSMPCNTAPCKDSGACDCMQNCLMSCAPELFADFVTTPVLTCSWERLNWDVRPAHSGLSVKPDPLPPRT